MPTVAALRRRGVPPEALRRLADMVGVAKNNSVVDIGKLEFCIRDTLNRTAPRAMAVLRPLEVVITNYPEGEGEQFDAPSFPPELDQQASRPLPLSRVLYIERDDFMQDPPAKFFRLAPGREVRLRFAYVIRCDEVICDEAGEVVQLRCSYDPDTLGKNPEGRRVRGTIHWVAAAQAVEAEVRLYDRLFEAEMPEAIDDVNPRSLERLTGCKLEPSLATASAGDAFQFERQGYFCVDAPAGGAEALVFNRTVTLRDSWVKERAKQGSANAPEEARRAKRAARKTPSRSKPSASRPSASRPSASDASFAPELDPAIAERATRYLSLGVAEVDSRTLAASDALGALFDAALRAGAVARRLANWLVNDVARELKRAGDSRLDGAGLAALLALLDADQISATSAKQVLATLIAEGGDPAAIVKARGLEQIAGDGIDPLIDQVLSAHPDEVARFREGKTQLMGFFVGQVMRQARGKADAQTVSERLRDKLAS
jgi:glutaminyl-tRNA synthetase